jgi:hypothetical protein
MFVTFSLKTLILSLLCFNCCPIFEVLVFRAVFLFCFVFLFFTFCFFFLDFYDTQNGVCVSHLTWNRFLVAVPLNRRRRAGGYFSNFPGWLLIIPVSSSHETLCTEVASTPTPLIYLFLSIFSFLRSLSFCLSLFHSFSLSLCFSLSLHLTTFTDTY